MIPADDSNKVLKAAVSPPVNLREVSFFFSSLTKNFLESKKVTYYKGNKMRGVVTRTAILYRPEAFTKAETLRPSSVVDSHRNATIEPREWPTSNSMTYP